MTSLNSAVNAIPVATWVSFATATVIPYLSALATKRPSALTGVLTALLAVASGFLSEWAASPHDFDWRAGLATAFGAWFVGTKWHDKVLKGTDVEAALYAALGGDPRPGTADPDSDSLPPPGEQTGAGRPRVTGATGGGCPAGEQQQADEDAASTQPEHRAQHASRD